MPAAPSRLLADALPYLRELLAQAARPEYGAFPGGDPRTFTPDPEMCTPEETARWKEACAEWDAGKGKPVPPPCSAIHDASGKVVGHAFAPRFGIGTYTGLNRDPDLNDLVREIEECLRSESADARR